MCFLCALSKKQILFWFIFKNSGQHLFSSNTVLAFDSHVPYFLSAAQLWTCHNVLCMMIRLEWTTTQCVFRGVFLKRLSLQFLFQLIIRVRFANDSQNYFFFCAVRSWIELSRNCLYEEHLRVIIDGVKLFFVSPRYIHCHCLKNEAHTNGIQRVGVHRRSCASL